MAKKSKLINGGGGSASASSGKVTDARFANFESDPRFRLPSKRQTKTKIDKRFDGVFKDEDFTKTAKVDRYGRPLSGEKQKKALKNLYEREDESSDDSDEDEDENEDGADIEVEDDEVVKRELRAADANYDPARGGGFESSSDESDSESDDGDKPGVEEAEAGGVSIQRFQDEQQDVPLGEVTNRIAIVNMDWDHIKSVDLFAVFSSFVPSSGRIEKVSIFPSEFGKERMAQEEVEGPPRDIFRKRAEDEDVDSEDDDDVDSEDDDEKIKEELLQEGDDQDFDTDALRSYQLDRLRYYYAIMVCGDKHTAETIYREVDGREYLASSNFLDLRFVPDDTRFDDQPRDECTGVPAGYRPVEFVTDALQHSKVKLTWDMHPDEVARKDSIKRAFGGSRNEIAENDLKAYLASDSSDNDEAEEEPVLQKTEADGEAEPKLTKKELARRKMREALGFKDSVEPKSSKSSGPVGEMQITFAPALSGKSETKEEVEETTIEKYKRKERERKEMKRDKARARREGRDPDAAQVVEQQQETEDLGFDDPFFQREGPEEPLATKSCIRKEERRRKREAREAEEKQKMDERANLELIMADDTGDAPAANKDSSKMSHFDMNEILKQEKANTKKLKGKAAKKQAAKDAAAGEKNLLQNDFEMDVDDDRFKAVFDDHEFAIDPSNPKFKATTGMKKLLEKGRNKRKGVVDDEDDASIRSSKKPKAASTGELSGLVQSVKRRSKRK